MEFRKISLLSMLVGLSVVGFVNAAAQSELELQETQRTVDGYKQKAKILQAGWKGDLKKALNDNNQGKPLRDTFIDGLKNLNIAPRLTGADQKFAVENNILNVDLKRQYLVTVFDEAIKGYYGRSGARKLTTSAVFSSRHYQSMDALVDLAEIIGVELLPIQLFKLEWIKAEKEVGSVVPALIAKVESIEGQGELLIEMIRFLEVRSKDRSSVSEVTAYARGGHRTETWSEWIKDYGKREKLIKSK